MMRTISRLAEFRVAFVEGLDTLDARPITELARRAGVGRRMIHAIIANTKCPSYATASALVAALAATPTLGVRRTDEEHAIIARLRKIIAADATPAPCPLCGQGGPATMTYTQPIRRHAGPS